MEFLHTADWQIGMKAAAIGDMGEKVRRTRVESAERVIKLARENTAEFVVVAGDTFEDNAVARVLVQKVADILEHFLGPVFVIPGNHDPLGPGSVWDHPAWKSAKNVTVLLDETPVDVPGGVLFPCPTAQKHGVKDPTAWILPQRGEQIRIGVAHGTVEGAPVEEQYFPIPRDAAAKRMLDYLALGHWHSFASYPDTTGATRMAYSGTHEPTKFGERDSGNALLVEISTPGTPPALRRLKSGTLDWIQLDENLRETADLARIQAQVQSMTSPDKTLFNLRLKGLIGAEGRTVLSGIEDLCSSRFLWSSINADQLNASPQDSAWISDMLPGVVHETAARLRDQAAAGGPPARIALRALHELYAILQRDRQ